MSGSFNPIQFLFTRVSQTIPAEILRVAFNPNNDPRINIDNAIRETVIDTRVLPDMNLRGARTKDIMLRKEMAILAELNPNDRVRSEGDYSLYRIPPELLEGGVITSVTSCTFDSSHSFSSNEFNGAGVGEYGNTFLGAAQRVIETSTGMNVPMTPKATLVSTDTVRLLPGSHSHVNYILSFKVSYDQDLNSLGEAAYSSFIELAICAIKSFIHNELILKLDKGYIQGGYEIGSFAEIVRSYSDQDQRYNELLVNFGGSNILADPKDLRKLLYYII